MLRDASLPPSCAAFRRRFEADENDRHADRCGACAGWSIHRRAVIEARAERRPMPADLMRRLQSIPERSTPRHDACPDAEQILRWAREPVGEHLDTGYLDTGYLDTGHLDHCARCRRLVTVLGAAIDRPPRALPPTLRRRLRRVGVRGVRPRSLAWAFDLRVASVAAALIGVLLIPISGPTAALARQAGNALAEPIKELSAEPEVPLGRRLNRLVDPLWASTARSLEGLQEKARDHSKSWLDLADRTLAVWRDLQATVANAADDNPGSGGHDDDD